MQRLTSQGQGIIADLAQRHGFSVDAVTHMLFAVLDGNGEMALFDHLEFAGPGQWMRGGMLMLSDMFDHELKTRVDALCHEISDILTSQPGLVQGDAFQSQSQSAGGHQGQSGLFVSGPSEHWWPSDLGLPSASGAQDDTRYAYFADVQRLAIQAGDSIRVYDTRDHRIAGFSQQQGAGGTITFTSQYGIVDLASLPLVSPETDIFDTIERLGDLKAKGILTEEEFATKKAELLSRL